MTAVDEDVTSRPSGSAVRVSRRPRGRSRNTRAAADAAVFMAPFLLVYAAFLVLPVVQAFYMSGFNWDLLGATREFIGGENFRRMLWGREMTWSLTHLWLWRLLIVAAAAWYLRSMARRGASRISIAGVTVVALLAVAVLGIHPAASGGWNDPVFWVALRNTLIFTLVSTPLLIALGLAMAVALNTKHRGTAVYRAVFFLPYVLPISAVTLIWSYLLNPDRGLIAGFLSWFGIDGIPFLTDPKLAMPAIIATTIWWSVGFNLVLFLAGLQDIEPSLIEAALLDGAGPWQRFRHITVPGLSHVMVLVTITQLIASFQIFGQVFIMTRGGPGTSTIVLIQHVYQSGFKNYQLGYAAALSVFLFVVMAAVSAVQFKLIAREN